MRRGLATDVRAGTGENFYAVGGAHHLPTPRWYARTQQAAVKLYTLIAQGVALVNAYHCGHQAFKIVIRSKTGPGQGIALFKFLDAVGHGAAVIVQVQQNTVVFNR